MVQNMHHRLREKNIHITSPSFPYNIHNRLRLWNIYSNDDLNLFVILLSNYIYKQMKMIARLTLLYGILFLFPILTEAQTFSITGRVADFKDTSALIGVSVILKIGSDTSEKTGLGAVTDANGKFQIDGVSEGSYLVHLEYIGYKSVNRLLNVSDKDVFVGIIAMKSASNDLKGVTITGKQVRAEQTGDTTSFHADAFKVNPDATTEDLITKMPGVTSDNTGVKVHGEAVQQVYVDGKPFFGTDPTLSVRNLPAEVVDQVQVYDQLSDQALFTGFDDGNSQKTMNIVTKKDKRKGEFGKVFGGYGTDGKYNIGGSFNSFEGDRRISIIESSNNINAQNFSSQDILGVSGGSSRNNFLTGQQPGITTTHSAGINYSDQWGPKIKVTASYFLNYTNNKTTTDKIRNYTFPTESGAVDSSQQSVYKENDISQSKNFNHRFNFRFEYTIDSSNSLVITPAASLQQNYSITGQVDSSFNSYGLLLSNATNNSISNNSGYNFNNNIVFRHKLHKKGRTISINLGTTLNAQSGDGTYNTISASVDTNLVYPTNPVHLNQIYNSYNNTTSVSSNIAYTEPLGKTSQLLFNYNPAVTYSKATTITDTLNNSTGQTQFDSVLSNKYLSTYFTQKGGLSYRFASKKVNFMIGANAQYATLDGTQTFPAGLNITRYFFDVLPIALFNYKFANGKNLRIFYRSNITPPGITQLQNVVNVNNPLQLSMGNPNLRQDYEQTLTLRYGLTRKKSAHNFFIFATANYINNYIGTATYTTLRADSAVGPGNDILLKKGAQLSAPVNLNYYSSNKIYLTYGIPFDIIKSNLNLTGGLNYTHTPGEVNYAADYSNDWVPSAGVVVSSNVSQNLDFTLSYTGNYNFVKNSLQGMANNNYYNHTASFKINWIFFKGFVINSNISNAYYTTLSSSSGNIDYYLWTSYIGYKFLKHRALEARITVFDILNQNKSVSRIVGANYVENDVTNILQRYAMLQLTYTLRNFKGPLPDANGDGEQHRRDWGGPGGGDFHGGGGNGGGGYHQDGGGGQ